MNATQRLIDYVMEKAAVEPAARRARIYRDLSTVVLSDAAAHQLVAAAEDLDAIDRRCRQLRLDLGDEGSGAPQA
jgi:hypothetical protein